VPLITNRFGIAACDWKNGVEVVAAVDNAGALPGSPMPSIFTILQ
jgi:hypothetical protein